MSARNEGPGAPAFVLREPGGEVPLGFVVDTRARAATIPDAAETAMLFELAKGLEASIGRLRST